MLQLATISTLSIEYIHIPVTARSAASDPTADTPQLAFIADEATNPADPDWVDGIWNPDLTGPTNFEAMALVGTGGKVLAAGTWHVWVKFADSPETPVRRSGRLVVE